MDLTVVATLAGTTAIWEEIIAILAIIVVIVTRMEGDLDLVLRRTMMSVPAMQT